MSEPAREREARIPLATFSYPLCGACEGETWHDGNHLRCDDCGLWFDSLDMEANLTHPDDPACGKPCKNTWHGAGKIMPDRGYECRPCALTEGHKSGCWNGCKVTKLEVAL